MPKPPPLVPPTPTAKVTRFGGIITVNRDDPNTLGLQADLVGTTTLADVVPIIAAWVAQPTVSFSETHLRGIIARLKSARFALAAAIDDANLPTRQP